MVLAERQQSSDLIGAEITPQEVYQRAAPAVVGIEAEANNLSFYGTGTIIHPRGIILTATSVIPQNATNIRVRFKQTSLKASILMMEPSTETTLLQLEPFQDKPISDTIKTENFPYLDLDNSDNSGIGETVYTLGNADGGITRDYQSSISRGIISARYSLERTPSYKLERLTGRYKGEVIETTAAVNGGIDGGPLINSSGRVIGMLIMNYSHSRWLGLAIPINNIPLLPDQRGSKLIPKLNKPLISESLPYGRWIPCIAKVKAVFNERSKFNIPRTSEGIVPLNSGLRRFIPDIDKEIELYALGPEVSVLAGIGFAKDDGVYVISSYAPVSGNLRSLTVAFMSDKPAEPQIYDAELRGYNEEFDLALLKIKTGITGTRTTSLTAAGSALGGLESSVSLRNGQDVLIIGANPDIAANTPAVSRGIVSATGRQDGAAFQIDARANHTNMGGPVFNSNGDFLGLCARYTQPLELGTNSGVSLVTAAAKIKEVLPDLLSGKKTARPPTPLLGVQLMPGVIDGGGVRIENVVPNTAASEAQPITGTSESGLKKGDVIIGFNYRDVLEYRQLVRLIRATRIGDTVILKVKRNNEALEFEVKMRGR